MGFETWINSIAIFPTLILAVWKKSSSDEIMHQPIRNNCGV